MARKRLSMRRTREVLRQKWTLGRSHREVARSLGMSIGGVSGVVRRAGAANLSWEQVAELSDEALEERLYAVDAAPRPGRPEPDFAHLHAELKRVGVTLQLLHLEYLEEHPDGYRYSRFCDRYRAWAKKRGLVMRQVHRAGEKLFVDYAGKKPGWVDRRTGEFVPAELFVAVLGASNFTYAEVTATQQSSDFIQSHVRALEFLGGVPGAIVPDQLRSGVRRPCRYEPGIQRTYEDLARHYETAILPARPGKARDKAKVEAGVLVAERWIVARLRHQTHFSLASLNRAVGELCDALNERVMRGYGSSRRELFERLERDALEPLPPERFVYAEWKLARVNIDYHVEIERHYYSAPFGLAREDVEVRVTARTVEIFHKGQCVAGHRRSFTPGRHTTNPEHMPASHRKHLEWTPSRLIGWGRTIGKSTAELIEAILADRPHPEQGYRSCLGILRLARRYGKERLEAACERAVVVRARSYRHVDSILKHGLDQMPLFDRSPEPPAQPVIHENIRGPAYYDPEGGDDADGTDDGEAARDAAPRDGRHVG
jgi:transposase